METIARDAGIDAKVAFLSRPDAYPGGTRAVEAIETHMSWVFLTDTHAWKLKKPQRIDGVDLSTVEARRRNALVETRLNRRFARDVYLGIVPLAPRRRGGLALGGTLPPLDWLVRMRRLPAARMLDQVIARGELGAGPVARVVEALVRVYGACAPEPIPGAAFRHRLAGRIGDNLRELSRFPHELDAALVAELAARQRGFLEREARLFDERVERGWVLEGHGDLRPEHVCLEDEPRIIDALEFARDLRIVDTAEELGFLALECERLGAPEARAWILDAYARAADDLPDDRLVHFYQGVHAGVRARLAIRHLLDPAARERERWPARARDYLRLAGEHLDRCASAKL